MTTASISFDDRLLPPDGKFAYVHLPRSADRQLVHRYYETSYQRGYGKASFFYRGLEAEPRFLLKQCCECKRYIPLTSYHEEDEYYSYRSGTCEKCMKNVYFETNIDSIKAKTMKVLWKNNIVAWGKWLCGWNHPPYAKTHLDFTPTDYKRVMDLNLVEKVVFVDNPPEPQSKRAMLDYLKSIHP